MTLEDENGVALTSYQRPGNVNEGFQREADGVHQNGTQAPPPSYNAATKTGGFDNKAFDANADVAIEIKDGDKKKKKGKNGKKKEEPPPMVGVLQTFRFGTGLDYLLMFLGLLGSVGHGIAMPLSLVFFGEMIDSFAVFGQLASILDLVNFGKYNTTKDIASKDFTILFPILYSEGYNQTARDLLAQGDIASTLFNKMTFFAYIFVGLGFAVMVASYVQIVCWVTTAERQIWVIRTQYFRSVMKQEIGWFDTTETGQLGTRLSDDVNKIKEGIGDKLGNFFQWFATFLTGIILGFINGWLLTLVILAVSPLLVICAGLMTKLASSLTSKELAAYAKAGGIAEEVISSIRTVVAFSGEEKETVRYNSNLSEAERFGVRKSVTNGLSIAFVWSVIFLAYALGFWYGSVLIHDTTKDYTVGKVIIVFFSVIFGAFALGSAAPNLQAFASSRGAAYSIYQIIDRKSAIDPTSTEGIIPPSMEGNVKFCDIEFYYPSRKEVKVMDNLNIEIKRGQTVALCGQSGCGKSTTVQLLQRFYDPSSGQVLLDGRDTKTLNIQWLRQHIGVVSQEPILFATTIAENIRYGRDDVTDEEIEKAAREANAHDFISDLPKKYETLVGERGAQLSGGQKQRIAIARALVRDPRILLLDEATSALDTESESVVQAALDKVKEGRTTLVIAHRLSTIQNADVIIGIKEGRNVEQGNHAELMAKEGLYYDLVMAQAKKKDGGEESESEDEEVPPPKIPVTQSSTKTPQKKSSIFGGSRGSLRQRKSSKKIHEEEEEEDEVKDGVPKEEVVQPSFGRVMGMNSPEWAFILVGCLASLVNGGIQPAFAIIFGEFLGVFGQTDRDLQRKQVDIFCLLFVGLAGLMFITMFLQSYMFGRSGEALTKRLRSLTFRAILRQSIAYFDDSNNSTGALTTRLAVEASAVQGATGARLGSVIQSIANMGTALVISFIFGWKLTLVILAFIPFIAVGGFVEMRIMAGVSNKDKEAVEEAGKVANEAIANIRTVAQLTKEMKFCDLYEEQLLGVYKQALKRAHLIGAVFGVTQGFINFVYAGAFVFGAYLVENEEMDFAGVFKVFGAIVFGAMALGQASSFAPDYGKAVAASGRIFTLLDRVPSIDSTSNDGEKPAKCNGAVELKAVQFRYPTRPNVMILRGLEISAKPGEVVALVGSSGCGKSTTVQLVERFYDAEDGAVMIDGKRIDSLNIKWLRSQIGIVSQEPILFDRSIAENISYGDNSRDNIPMSEIIEAARSANIHSFIESLPQGYETNCGDKGTQLSGGQKQRVAIARALIRNPRILLLDEATSALDTESEKVVQEALDKAQRGRTSIVIAHRLSTIRDADKIFVIQHGKVKEVGHHEDLLAAKGIYHKLNSIQEM